MADKTEQEAFEEVAYLQYFPWNIKTNPNLDSTMKLSASQGTKNKVEFLEKREDGRYKDRTVDAAWWGWQARGEYDQTLRSKGSVE